MGCNSDDKAMVKTFNKYLFFSAQGLPYPGHHIQMENGWRLVKQHKMFSLCSPHTRGKFYPNRLLWQESISIPYLDVKFPLCAFPQGESFTPLGQGMTVLARSCISKINLKGIKFQAYLLACLIPTVIQSREPTNSNSCFQYSS